MGEWIGTILFNTLINWMYGIPAAIALVLHFVMGISIWWFIGLLILWVGGTAAFTMLISPTKKSIEQEEAKRKYPRHYSSRR